MFVTFLVVFSCMRALMPANVVCHNVDIMFPFIYANPAGVSNRSNYFGYAVAADSSKTPWVLISAPRGNSTIYQQELEPGTVYKCDIPGKCQILNLTIAGWKNKDLKGLANNSWTGAVLDVKEEKILICAPRWKARKEQKKRMFMFGMCYLMTDFVNEPCKLLPLIDKERIVTHKNQMTEYNYGLGMYGMSASFSQVENVTKILGGSPGTLDFYGSAVLFRHLNESFKSGTCGINSGEHFYTPSPIHNSKFLKGYLGYEVSIGRFFSETEINYVAGAPRAADLYGAVLVFIITPSGDKIKELWRQRGTQYGEYFGAALAVADVTGDGLDDLIVGAPFYTEKCDEGRIYIYLGQGGTERKLEHSTDLTFKGSVSNGRFGSVISSIGDINNDGFHDIAVGAPYEEDNRGAIYIFNGFKSGLKLSQCIRASQISNSLKGFGISIHHTHEVCNTSNKYLVIGSYISGNAVVLRSYPVITLNISQTSPVKQLQQGDTQFNISVCMTYNGLCVPKKLQFQRNLVLEPGFPVSILKAFPGSKSELEDIVTLSVGNTTCEIFNILLNKVDITVEEFKFNISMQPHITKHYSTETSPIFVDGLGQVAGKDGFCTECVEVDKSKSQTFNILKIPYTRSCGVDNKCVSDLEVHSEFIGKMDGKQFIIGSSDDLQIILSVRNTGEKSRMTVINCYLPDPIKLSNGNRLCKEVSTSSGVKVECQLDTALDHNSTVNITLNLNLADLAKNFLFSNITITTSGVTSNEDLNPENNVHVNTIHIIAKADMKINGFPERDPVSYVSKEPIKFHHLYKVKKSGPSPVKETEFDVQVPIKWRKYNGDIIKFMEVYNPQATQGQDDIQCSSEIKLKKLEDQNTNQDSMGGHVESEDENEDEFNMAPSNTPTLKQNNSAVDLKRRKRQIDNISKENILTKSSYIPMSSETLYLNCSRSEVICEIIKCKTAPFFTTLSEFTFNLSMEIDIDSIGFLIQKKPILHVTTHGSVSIFEPKSLSQRKEQFTISTSIIDDAPKKKVKLWVYLVSAVGGILLLLFIVMGLVKAGFFKRKLKDDLEKLKLVDATNELFPLALIGIKSGETNKSDLENDDPVEDETDTPNSTENAIDVNDICVNDH